MENVMMYVVSSAIQMIVLYIYLREIVGVKRKFGWMVGCWSMGESVNILVRNITTLSIINGIVILISWIMIAYFMCKGSLKRVLILMIMYYGINAIIESGLVGTIIVLTNSTMEVIANNNNIATFLMILTQMLVVFAVQIVKHFWKKQLSYDVGIKNWLGTLGVSIGCVSAVFILAVEMVRNNSFSVSQIIVLFILVVVNFLSYYFYYVSVESNRIEMESKIYQQQISMYQEWYESNKHTRNEIRAFRHDIKNHFAVLKKFCKNALEKKEESLLEMQRYLDKIDMHSNLTTYQTDSGNMILDAIIDLKKGYALSRGINIDVELKVPQGMNCDSKDMVILLVNLLDNAIEACERVGEEQGKEIVLHITYEMKNLMIKMENTYDGDMDGMSGGITDVILWKTKKKDSSEHGIGMQNIMSVVTKYNGSIEWKAEDKRMSIVILLYGIV